MNYKLIAEKIANILNGEDSETNELNIQKPTDLYFEVQTQGFHLDHITNKEKGVNFIPVFLSAMGGNRNPVPDLKQGDYTLPITFFFPVRFKDNAFALDDFLADCFCGRRLNYGTSDNPLHCVSNISVAQFGEIQELDLKEFASWLANTYKKEVRVAEPYISVQYTLYLSNADESYAYGNDIEATLMFKASSLANEWKANNMYWHHEFCVYNNELYQRKEVGVDGATWDASKWTLVSSQGYMSEKITFASGSLLSNSQITSEQEMGTNESNGLPLATSYASSFTFNIKNNTFFLALMRQWAYGNIQKLRGIIKIDFSKAFSDLDISYYRNCFVQSINMPILKGEPLTMTITLNKVVEE